MTPTILRDSFIVNVYDAHCQFMLGDSSSYPTEILRRIFPLKHDFLFVFGDDTQLVSVPFRVTIFLLLTQDKRTVLQSASRYHLGQPSLKKPSYILFFHPLKHFP